MLAITVNQRCEGEGIEFAGEGSDGDADDDDDDVVSRKRATRSTLSARGLTVMATMLFWWVMMAMAMMEMRSHRQIRTTLSLSGKVGEEDVPTPSVYESDGVSLFAETRVRDGVDGVEKTGGDDDANV